MHSKLLLFLAMLTLSGCIGSSILVEDADTNAPFPDLHDVPERPALPDHAAYTATTESLSKSHHQDLEENKRLRQHFGLDSQP